jgi:hypothetical protein
VNGFVQLFIAVIAVAGLIVGRLAAAIMPTVILLIGLAGAATYPLFMVTAPRGCAGGGCIGNIFALFAIIPFATGCTGMAVSAGYVLARRRFVDDRTNPWLSRLVTMLFWSLPIAALLTTGAAAVAERQRQNRVIAEMNAA